LPRGQYIFTQSGKEGKEGKETKFDFKPFWVGGREAG
jgi:hypothetical protein